MFTRKSTETKKVTKTLAKEFAEMDVLQDRPLKESLLELHRRNVKNGTMRPPHWASAFCVEDGKIYRVNGKHTSTIFSEMSDMNGAQAIVERYECETKSDVAELFQTFDERKSARTNGQIYGVWQATVPSLSCLRTRVVHVAVNGMAFATWEDANYLHPPADRAALMVEYPDFILFLDELFDGDYKHISRGPVVAAIFKSWQKNQRDAKEFWIAVRDGSGNPNTVPDRKLSRILLSHSLASGRGARSGKETMGMREMYIECVKHWNAWRRGESISHTRFQPSAKTPAAV